MQGEQGLAPLITSGFPPPQLGCCNLPAPASSSASWAGHVHPERRDKNRSVLMDSDVLSKLQKGKGLLLEFGSSPLGAGGTSSPEITWLSKGGQPGTITGELTLKLPK